ncbi:MAG TPA: universal stress protein [Candidatus Thermoplasmatota archaeon]|nr:universal stress protein [Candidatus Thermoplasmatota archaeon]
MGRILVGIDGSPVSQRALAHAAERARAEKHELVLLTIVPAQVARSTLTDLLPAGLALPPELSRTFEEAARKRLEEQAGALAASGVKVLAEVRAGETVDEFVRAAAELGATEIVIGHKSYQPGHVEVGPNAAAISERANVRVTLIP